MAWGSIWFAVTVFTLGSAMGSYGRICHAGSGARRRLGSRLAKSIFVSLHMG